MQSDNVKASQIERNDSRRKDDSRKAERGGTNYRRGNGDLKSPDSTEQKYKNQPFRTSQSKAFVGPSLPKTLQTASAKFNLFSNSENQKKLILKRNPKNIRLGYKKILKRDLSYDELYQEKEAEEGEFLCCKKYKKYVDTLWLYRQEHSWEFPHKEGIDYLCEVACNELSQADLNKSNYTGECGRVGTCPLNYCKDTFCSQCNLCRIREAEKNQNLKHD